MSTFQNAERDAADLAKGMNEDTTFNTRYGENPKKSFPMAIRQIDEAKNTAIAEFYQALDQYKESRGFNNKGTFADGFTYELPNDVGIDASGNPWIYNGSLPFIVTAGTAPSSPTYTQVAYGAASQVSTNTSDTVQSFVDSFALKIFQSPTDGGLTEIKTRTVNANEVYEIRKTSDDSLATIYSDAAGTTEIVQDGTSNVSGSDGVVTFYIADGDYKITSLAQDGSFSITSKKNTHYSLSECLTASLKLGDYIRITDYGNALYRLVDINDAGGFYLNYNSALKLKLVAEPKKGRVLSSWFGIDNTESVDNTALYDQIWALGYTNIHFVAGTYLGTVNLQTNHRIIGDDYDSTTLKAVGNKALTTGARKDGWFIDDITIDGADIVECIGIEANAYSSRYIIGENVRINNCGLWGFVARGGLDWKFYANGISNGELTTTNEGGFAFVDTTDGTSGGGVATTYKLGGYAQSGGKYGYKIFRTVAGVLSGIAEGFERGLDARSCSSLILDNFYTEDNTDLGSVVTLVDTPAVLVGGRYQEEPNISWVNAAGDDRFVIDLRSKDVTARKFKGAKVNLSITQSLEDNAELGDIDMKDNYIRVYDPVKSSMERVALRVRGTTAQRPSPAAGDIGYTYYDTDLGVRGLPIWWTGSTWIDAAGNVV